MARASTQARSVFPPSPKTEKSPKNEIARETGKSHLGPCTTVRPFDATFSRVRLLSQAIYGRVIQCRHPRTGRMVAAKVCDRAQVGRRQGTDGHGRQVPVLEDVEAELALLRLLSSAPYAHPNLQREDPTAKELAPDPSKLYVVTPYAAGGDLYSYLENEGAFSEYGAARLLHSLASGLRHLHEKVGYAHRDISLENILMHVRDDGEDAGGDAAGAAAADPESTSVRFELCDFGQAVPLPPDGEYFPCQWHRPGKTFFLAPEVWAKEPYCGRKADVFSLGIVFFAVFARGCPYGTPDRRIDAAARAVFDGRLDALVRKWRVRMPRGARRLCQRMLSEDPDCRPTLDQVLADPWLCALVGHDEEQAAAHMVVTASSGPEGAARSQSVPVVADASMEAGPGGGASGAGTDRGAADATSAGDTESKSPAGGDEAVGRKDSPRDVVSPAEADSMDFSVTQDAPRAAVPSPSAATPAAAATSCDDIACELNLDCVDLGDDAEEHRDHCGVGTGVGTAPRTSDEEEEEEEEEAADESAEKVHAVGENHQLFNDDDADGDPADVDDDATAHEPAAKEAHLEGFCAKGAKDAKDDKMPEEDDNVAWANESSQDLLSLCRELLDGATTPTESVVPPFDVAAAATSASATAGGDLGDDEENAEAVGEPDEPEEPPAPLVITISARPDGGAQARASFEQANDSHPSDEVVRTPVRVRTADAAGATDAAAAAPSHAKRRRG